MIAIRYLSPAYLMHHLCIYSVFLLQQLSLALALTSGAVYAANILSQEKVDAVVVKIYQDHCANVNVSNFFKFYLKV
jgi:hypothetical protein